MGTHLEALVRMLTCLLLKEDMAIISRLHRRILTPLRCRTDHRACRVSIQAIRRLAKARGNLVRGVTLRRWVLMVLSPALVLVMVMVMVLVLERVVRRLGAVLGGTCLPWVVVVVLSLDLLVRDGEDQREEEEEEVTRLGVRTPTFLHQA